MKFTSEEKEVLLSTLNLELSFQTEQRDTEYDDHDTLLVLKERVAILESIISKVKEM